jgi:acetyl-CoA C-acetyltransferase
MIGDWGDWRALDPRTPVVVGVGQVHQQLDEPGAGDGPIALMARAAAAAGRDAGAPGLLSQAGLIAVPEGSWRYKDPGRLVGRLVGAEHARTLLSQAGIPQQTLLDHALKSLLDGGVDVALIVGGEAARRQMTARRAGLELASDAIDDNSDVDEQWQPAGEMVSPVEVAVGVYTPAELFALIDSTLRHAEGRTVEQHRREIADLWAGYSAVAGAFAHAEYRQPKTADDIRETGPDNRPVAFPYNKWHCSQMYVDQAAALLLTTLGVAERAGVDASRVAFPLVAIESSFSLAVPRRRDLHRWPAMEVLGFKAAEHLGRGLHTIEHAELYSCFPAAVRVQQRALGLDPAGIPTITGGEPFAGGPWNNFVLQAMVAMVERLRRCRGELGIVTSVSGFLNKPGISVFSTEPAERGLLLGDFAEEAATATPTLPLADGHVGAARIAAATVSYQRTGEARAVVIADTPSAERCMAVSSDDSIIARATTTELVGARINIADLEFTLV